MAEENVKVQTGALGLDTRRGRGSSSTMSRVYVASLIQHEDKVVSPDLLFLNYRYMSDC